MDKYISFRCHAKFGETLLVHGASGAVGIASVQLGKMLGDIWKIFFVSLQIIDIRNLWKDCHIIIIIWILLCGENA